MNETDKQIIAGYVEQFVSRSIGTECPNGYCLSLSMVLNIYFGGMGISNIIVGGKMNGTDHFWIELPDYKTCMIVDATIKQFNKGQDAIYIGEKAKNTITLQYSAQIMDRTDWSKVYSSWSSPTHLHGIRRSVDVAEKIIIHNIINASILITEIEKLKDTIKLQIKDSRLFVYYIRTIFSWLKDESIVSPRISDILTSKISKEFEFLEFQSKG